MERILTFTSGPADWQPLLAQPDKHWRRGYSARTLAHCWEEADGFPAEVQEAFSESELAGLTPLIAVPEFKVPLPPVGGRASQNDIFVLAKSANGPVAIMVEGKVHEPFGPPLGKWNGDPERLKFLLATLGLTAEPDGAIRYQLLHRAASAIITAEQYRAVAAVLLVHSWSRKGWTDYQAFARLFSAEPKIGSVHKLTGLLFGAWIDGDPRYLEC